MGNQAYGREELVFVKQESSYGTLAYPAGTDAIRVLKCDLSGAQERADIPEKGLTRSQITRVTRRKSASWSIEKYVRPSGTAGTAPDDTDLWEALFGTKTVSAGTSVAYSLLREPTANNALSIHRLYGPHSEAVCGAVASKLSLKWGGSDEPKITFSGDAKDHLLSGSDTLSASVSASDKIIVTDARQFAVGMRVKVGTEDNTGAGFTIESINYTTNELDLAASVTSQASGAAVIPMPLTPVYTGSVIPVIVGTVKIGTTTIYVTGGSFDVDQKLKLRNDEFGSATARGVRHPERREVTCSFDLYFESGAAKWLNDAKRFTAQDVEVVLGDTAGSKLQIDAAQVEFEIPKVSVPESDEATISLGGKCLGTSSYEDEITMTFK